MTKQLTLAEKLRAATPALDELDLKEARLRGFYAQLRAVPRAAIPDATDFLDPEFELPKVAELAQQHALRTIAEELAAEVHSALKNLLPLQREGAILDTLPARVSVLQAELRRLHGDAVSALTRMGNVTDANQAINRGVTDEWKRVGEIAGDLRSVRVEQKNCAVIAGIDRGPWLVASLTPDLS